MIGILLSWLYIFITSYLVGFWFSKRFDLPSKSAILVSILGLFGTTVVAFVWAFFAAINGWFYLIYLLLILTVFFYYQKELYLTIRLQWQSFVNFDFWIRLFTILFLLSLALQTATMATLPDNESYYIQTIQWINSYGFIKGLGNLHLFLAQTSGWHVLQAVYNFSFLADNIASISGYITAVALFFSCLQLQKYVTYYTKINLLFALFPLFFICFFPLINVPSPDVAIYCISIILFYYFLATTENFTQNFRVLVLLALFLVFIKITSLPLLLLPLYYLVKYRSIVLKRHYVFLLFGVFCVSLLFLKNGIITGYLFYPLHSLGIWDASYAIPNAVLDYFLGKATRYSFFVDAKAFENASFWELCQKWLWSSKTDFIFNISALVGFVVGGLLVWKDKNSKFRVLYLVLLIQFVLLVFSSPQYRFFMGTILFFFCYFFSKIITSKRVILIGYFCSLVALQLFIFNPKVIKLVSSNKIIQSRTALQWKTWIFSAPKSSLITDFNILKNQNLKYYSPRNPDVFWETGNGNLPCVSQNQIKYFETYFKIIPQPIGTDISEGFYSKTTLNP